MSVDWQQLFQPFFFERGAEMIFDIALGINMFESKDKTLCCLPIIKKSR